MPFNGMILDIMSHLVECDGSLKSSVGMVMRSFHDFESLFSGIDDFLTILGALNIPSVFKLSIL